MVSRRLEGFVAAFVGDGAVFRKVDAPIAELFPAHRTASALIVAILVRADEIAHMLRWMSRAEVEENERDKRGDPRQVLDRLILARFLMVSLVDGLEHLSRFRNLPEIRSLVSSAWEAGKPFNQLHRDLQKKVKTLEPIRHKLGAHIDSAVIAAQLARTGQGVHGELWLASGQHFETQYDSAHHVVMAAWIGAVPPAGPVDFDRVDLADYDALINQAIRAQVDFVAAARVALALFQATATQTEPVTVAVATGGGAP